MDKNEFFRQATLRICGNLEIEVALFEALRYLRNVIPVEKIFLELFDEGFNAVRAIAYATLTEGKEIDLLTPVSEQAKSEYLKARKLYSSDVYITKKQEYDRLSNDILNFHNLDVASLMVLRLESNNKLLGAVVLLSDGEYTFTKEDGEWLSILKEPFTIAMSNALKHREAVRLKELLTDDNRYLQSEIRQITGDEIIGADFGLKDVMEKVRHVSALDSPVLLLGETGVGKDVIANAIHYTSFRKDHPFVKVNCGAIPESLIDSELFGHEKGAFTGAINKIRGRFERAEKGTIFLDEIGELPAKAQVRLLRVLQDKEIERVGGERTIKLDIRIIAATNKNLEQMVREERFREDLWFRLNVFPIWVPPLRQRISDIPALLQYFIVQKVKELKLPFIPELAPGAIEPLLQYHWPGNVRELENLVEHSLILNPKGPLTFEYFKIVRTQKMSDVSDSKKKFEKLDVVIASYLQDVLLETGGKIHGPGGAGELLGINPNTLRNRLNKLGIKFGRSNK